MFSCDLQANAVSVATVVLAQAENRQWPAALQQLLGFDDRGSAKQSAERLPHLILSPCHPGKRPKNAGVKCDVDACASVLTEACHLKGMETDSKQPHSYIQQPFVLSMNISFG